MRSFCLCLALLILQARPGVAADGEYRDLFNGKDLAGWLVEGPKTDKQGNTMWTVRDGSIVCLGKGFGFLRYEKEQFGDFAMRVEYRFAPNQRGNSGVGIRTIPFDSKQSRQTRPSFAAYEIQLQDDAGKPASVHTTGSLYRFVAPTANPARPAPEWNTIEIECTGPRIRVAVNGERILDANQNDVADIKDKPAGAKPPRDKALSGYVCLQSHTGQVEFRKVQIRRVD